jgi:hypothetical protein
LSISTATIEKDGVRTIRSTWLIMHGASGGAWEERGERNAKYEDLGGKSPKITSNLTELLHSLLESLGGGTMAPGLH